MTEQLVVVGHMICYALFVCVQFINLCLYRYSPKGQKETEVYERAVIEKNTPQDVWNEKEQKYRKEIIGLDNYITKNPPHRYSTHLVISFIYAIPYFIIFEIICWFGYNVFIETFYRG